MLSLIVGLLFFGSSGNTDYYICPESDYIEIASYTHPEDANYSIGIVIQEQLYNIIGSTLMDQWMYDISNDYNFYNKYSAAIIEADFPSAEELRSWLLEWHGSSDDPLLGIILVGDIPYAECKWTNTDIDLLTMGYKETDIFPSDFFFMDLTGEWLDTNQDGYYDSWPQMGYVYCPEIFCGRFPFNRSFPQSKDIKEFREYLINNHEWRYNGDMSEGNLLYVDDDWAYGSSSHSSHLSGMINWSELFLVHYFEPNTTRHDHWISIINSENLLWATVFVHGNPSAPYHRWAPAGAGTTYVEHVANADILFYNLWHCYGGNYLFWHRSMAEAYLYTSDCLAVIASSKAGAMDYVYDFYHDLSNYHSIGHAFQDWWDARIKPFYELNDQSGFITWCMGLQIFGDPTLRPNKFQ